MADVYPTTIRGSDGEGPCFSPVASAEEDRSVLTSRVSWGAILVGIATTLVVQVILALVGVGIGASAFHDPGAISIGAGSWWAVSGIVAAFAGGYVAGRLSRQPKKTTGGWHGLASWTAAALIAVVLLGMTVDGRVGGAFATVLGALLASLALLLGALSAWFGGRMGAVDPTVTAHLHARRTVTSAA